MEWSWRLTSFTKHEISYFNGMSTSQNVSWMCLNMLRTPNTMQKNNIQLYCIVVNWTCSSFSQVTIEQNLKDTMFCSIVYRDFPWFSMIYTCSLKKCGKHRNEDIVSVCNNYREFLNLISKAWKWVKKRRHSWIPWHMWRKYQAIWCPISKLQSGAISGVAQVHWLSSHHDSHPGIWCKAICSSEVRI